MTLRTVPITGDQYWRSSLVEVKAMLKGADNRERGEWQRTAWMTSMLMNVSGKSLDRAVTPDELLTGQQMSPEHRRDLDERVRQERALRKGA